MGEVVPISSYRTEGLVVYARFDKEFLEKCRTDPLCISPSLSSQDIVDKVKRTLGSDDVLITSMARGMMPWSRDYTGEQLPVEMLLENMTAEGWPGYDVFLEGVRVYRRTRGLPRREIVYEIRPVATGFELGSVEVQPVQQHHAA